MVQVLVRRLGGIGHLQFHAAGAHVARIACLAAGFAIERRIRQHHDTLLVRCERFHTGAIP